jgi:hypothetical protein
MMEINRNDGSVENMTVETFARWMCLVEAFDFIEQKAKELKVDWVDMIKPLAIETYIHGNKFQGVDGRYLSMLHDVKCEHKLGLI